MCNIKQVNKNVSYFFLKVSKKRGGYGCLKGNYSAISVNKLLMLCKSHFDGTYLLAVPYFDDLFAYTDLWSLPLVAVECIKQHSKQAP